MSANIAWRGTAAALTFACALGISGCGAWGQVHYRQLHREMRAHAFAPALQRVEHGREPIYGRKQELLYWLDRAVLLQSTGHFADSSAALETAKTLQRALYTQRVTDHAGALVIGERNLPYVAEPFEQVAMHLLEADNYLAMGLRDEAGVELRAMGATLSRCNQQAEQSGSLYRDDAAGRWLAGLLREADRGELGALSDARIDLESALSLYEQVDQPHFGTPVPQALRDDVARVQAALAAPDRTTVGPHTPARAVLLFADGAAPRKQEAFWQALVPPWQVFKVAYPVFVVDPRPPMPVWWADTGRNQRAPVELASDLANKARVHLAERMDAIRGAAIKRALARAVATGSLQVAGAATGGSAGALMEVVGVGLNIVGTATEHADVRSWQTLPARLSMGAILVTPGRYALEVQGRDGDLLHRFEGVAKPGETLFFVLRAF